MHTKEIFSVKDFANYARTTRDTLLYYDKIGLLTPVSRGENNYRFYSSGQLAVINLIRTLKTLGVPLEEIKRLKDSRTPELSDSILETQLLNINEKINALIESRELLSTLKDTIHSHLNVDVDEIIIRELPTRDIVLGEQNDYRDGRTDYDALYDFYAVCRLKYPNLDLNYPVWAMFSQERIINRDWVYPDKYYFYGPKGYDKIPAALYAIGYTRGGYGESSELYERLLKYIEKEGYEICGPAYEEYPLNEICVIDQEDYLMKITITVKKMKKPA